MSESTISFAGYTFDSDKGCFTCQHVWTARPFFFLSMKPMAIFNLCVGQPGMIMINADCCMPRIYWIRSRTCWRCQR
jgi:hypothetical protein